MKIEGFHGYNVKFSPHDSSEIGIIGGYNFGMSGIRALAGALTGRVQNKFLICQGVSKPPLLIQSTCNEHQLLQFSTINKAFS